MIITNDDIQKMRDRVTEKLMKAHRDIDSAFQDLKSLTVGISVKLTPNKKAANIVDMKTELKFYTGQYVDGTIDELHDKQVALFD